MKEVYTEEIIKKLKYEAMDGTQFTTIEECNKYERSARCATNALYNKLVIKSLAETDLFHVGSDDNTLNLVKVKSQEDIKILLQMYTLYVSSDEQSLNRIVKLATKAMETNDILIIGRGYDEDCFWVINTKQDLINTFNNICNETN